MFDDLNCFNPVLGETMREELIENCGKMISVFNCCCNQNVPFEGVVLEVGRNFLELAVGITPTIVIIPLGNIIAFREITGAGNENQLPGTCGSRRSFRNRLLGLSGKCVTVPWCVCNEIRTPTGTLGEVGFDFLELLDVNGSGEDLVMGLSTVCAVMTHTGPCPSATPTPTPTMCIL